MLETLHQEAFAVHVGEAEGTLDLRGALGAAPRDDRVDERLRHVEVLDEVDPSEADGLLLPFLVGLVVDDGGDAADDFPVPPGQIQFPLAEREGRILVGQGLEFVTFEGGDPLGAVLEQFEREADELLEHAPPFHTYDFDRFHGFTR
jgi:hypothetical protein